MVPVCSGGAVFLINGRKTLWTFKKSYSFPNLLEICSDHYCSVVLKNGSEMKSKTSIQFYYKNIELLKTGQFCWVSINSPRAFCTIDDFVVQSFNSLLTCTVIHVHWPFADILLRGAVGPGRDEQERTKVHSSGT